MHDNLNILRFTVEKLGANPDIFNTSLQLKWNGRPFHFFRLGSNAVVYEEVNDQSKVPEINDLIKLRSLIVNRQKELSISEKDLELQLELIDQAKTKLRNNGVWRSRFGVTDKEAILEETQMKQRYEMSIFKVIIKWITEDHLTILEAGSGSGRMCIALAKKYPDSKVIGVDLLSEAIVLANSGAQLQNVDNAKFIRGDIFNLANIFPQDKFDVVFSEGVYEHFIKKESELFVDIMRRLVRPGGTIIVSVPNARSPVYRFWKCIASENLVYRFGLERNVYAKEVIGLFHKLGIKQIEVGGSDPVYGLRKIYRIEEKSGNPIPLWWSPYARKFANWIAPLVDLLNVLTGHWLSRRYGFDFIVKGIVPTEPSDSDWEYVEQIKNTGVKL